MEYQLSLESIRDLLGKDRVEEGQFSGPIVGIASLADASDGDLSFCMGERYRRELETTRASVVLLPSDFSASAPEGKLYFRVEQPSVVLAQICAVVESQLWPKPEPGIHPSAIIQDSAQVDPTATVGPLCVVEAGAEIGPEVHLVAQVSIGRSAVVESGSWLAPQVTLSDYCRVGPRCRIHAGTVIGSDGFGYEPVDQSLMKLPQIGIVSLEADVEIGANCTLDRARFAETRIGEGTKIDNLVHIAHNVKIGKHCAIAAQVGISGSSTIGNGVLFYGQAGMAGHLTIGDGAVVAGGAGVTKNVDPGQTVRGNPILDISTYNRLAVLQRKLPEFVKRIENLEEFLKKGEGAGSN